MAKKKTTSGKKTSSAKASSKKTTSSSNGTPVRITSTTLRDGHQCLWGSRMRTRDMLGIVDVIDNVGYYSIEVWGGATFDVCLRYLRENPWERLRQINKMTSKTPLQMLLRGQNILGFRSYPDDVLDKFIQQAVQNGMEIFRIFDALNDVRNIEKAVESVTRYGGHVQGTLVYTESPVHTIEKFVEYAEEQVALGVDSLVIKDMAGLLTPFTAHELITALKKNIKLPIQIHSHSTGGMATSAYVAGVRAGAGALDTAISPLAGFTSQPPVESIVEIFQGTRFDPKLDRDALTRVGQYFRELAPQRKSQDFPANLIDQEMLVHRIPSVMLNELRSILEQENAMERWDDAIEEMTKVRKELGYPPLVTPCSQIVTVQAAMNVLSGKRYSAVADETRDYIKGCYGRPPAPVDPKISRKVLGKEKVMVCRPADLLEPGLPEATNNLDPALVEKEEDILSYLIFPEAAVEYFEWRSAPFEERAATPAEQDEAQATEAAAKDVAAPEPEEAPPLLPPKDYDEMHHLLDKINGLGLTEFTIRRNDLAVSVKGNGVQTSRVNNDMPERTPSTPVAPSPSDEVATEPEDPGGHTVNAPLNGTFYRSPAPDKPNYCEPGDEISEGDVICIVEAMKLFNEIKVPSSCTVVKFLVNHGDAVEKGQPLMSYS